MEKPVKPRFYYSIHVVYIAVALLIFIYSEAFCRFVYPQDWFVLVGRLVTLLALISVYSTLFMSYKQSKNAYNNEQSDDLSSPISE